MSINNKVLDIYRPKNETLNDAFDRFVVKIHHQNRMYGHKTFVLTGCEPMVGTTTISINVAISLAMSGLKTILIDGDLRKDGKYKRLGDTLEMGLSDVLSGNLDLASAICATNYVTLDYLPSGIKDENPVGLLYSPNLDKVIAGLSEYYDYIIFDLPSANAAIDSNIFASKVDAVILVAGQNSTTSLQIKNAKRELEKIAANLIGIVFNNVDSREYRKYMKNYDYFNKEKFINQKSSKNTKEEVIENLAVDESAFDLGYDQYKDESMDNANINESIQEENVIDSEYVTDQEDINLENEIEQEEEIDIEAYVDNEIKQEAGLDVDEYIESEIVQEQEAGLDVDEYIESEIVQEQEADLDIDEYIENEIVQEQEAGLDVDEYIENEIVQEQEAGQNVEEYLKSIID